MSEESDAGRVWFITGTSSGFGRAIAEEALAGGERVVATARRPEALGDLIEKGGERVFPLSLDVTDAGQRQQAIDAAVEHFGRIDVLVNNAGRTQVGAVEETTEDELRGLFELHFFAPAALTAAGSGGPVVSEPMSDYAETVGPTRDYVASNHGKQPGDPQKAAAAIATALDADKTPLRLVLGADAIGNIRDRWGRLDEELSRWEDLGRNTAIDS